MWTFQISHPSTQVVTLIYSFLSLSLLSCMLHIDKCHRFVPTLPLQWSNEVSHAGDLDITFWKLYKLTVTAEQ